MYRNISISFVGVCCICLAGCNETGSVTEKKETVARESKQEQFIRKLFLKKLIAYDSVENIKNVIGAIMASTRFQEKFRINNYFDSSYLNFYILDSDLDTSLRNICAYAGNNTILLDRVFLSSYLDSCDFYKPLPPYKQMSYYSAFQFWVISHEIAHADLKHDQGHFINSQKPKDQETARQFHSLELKADKRILAYMEDQDKIFLSGMLVGLFNAEYDKLYGMEKNENKYLQVINDPYLTYPYKLDGSHSTMTIRCCILLYLLHSNAKLDHEVYQFLSQSQLNILKDLAGDTFN